MNELKNKTFIMPWFSVAGAMVVMICFFLPWLEVRCSGKKIIGSGFTFAQDERLLWLIPVFAMLIILLFVGRFKGISLSIFRFGAIFAACLGLFMMMMTYISIEQKLSGFIARKITSHQIKPGLLGTILGFLFVIVTALFSRKKNE